MSAKSSNARSILRFANSTSQPTRIKEAQIHPLKQKSQLKWREEMVPKELPRIVNTVLNKNRPVANKEIACLMRSLSFPLLSQLLAASFLIRTAIHHRHPFG